MNSARIGGSIATLGLLVAVANGCSAEAGSTEPIGTDSEALRKRACGAMLSTHHPIGNVKRLEVVDDRRVVEGGGLFPVEVRAPDHDTNWASKTTCAGLYDALLTSDPKSGGDNLPLGVLGPVAWNGSDRATVIVNTWGLPAGTYWIRLWTEHGPGTFEAAEGVVLVH